ncbi:hypothetical protein HYH03_010815 [Edaphochlamys debaryana]|uniref:Uncharacterized protein n=1 Tax=Edaphochlamys debaryana TaxID=47281 RepID=A0A836BWE7_9CHLO|nr:hypothetical protein HYH03_010815 [Edaphochlamys debaryana]|eukprot:KAG2490902.1 hypothetical protein HYH03_010815 [Edaphochlamys debaryana]
MELEPGSGGPPPTGHAQRFLDNINGNMRKRPRSNPGMEGVGYEDLLGMGRSLSPLSDPDIDCNMQSSKRYLSEVMANNLTRHMNLRGPSTSMGGGPMPGLDDLLTGGGPRQEAAQEAESRGVGPQAPHLPPGPYQGSAAAHLLGHLMHPPLTPPDGCSPQRTPGASMSEMSEGGAEGAPEVIPMLCSDRSVSGNRGASAAESTSETADSELAGLEERERTDGLGALPWSAAAAAAASAGGAGGGPGGGTSPLLARRLSDAQGGLPGPGPGSISVMRSPTGYGSPAGFTPRALLPRGPLADIPTSPSDTRFGVLDLRKTALLRSLSRRTEEISSDGGMGSAGSAAAAAAAAAAGLPDGAVGGAAAGLGLGPALEAAGAGGGSGPGAGCRLAQPLTFFRDAAHPALSGASEGMSEGGGGFATGMDTGMDTDSSNGGQQEEAGEQGEGSGEAGQGPGPGSGMAALNATVVTTSGPGRPEVSTRVAGVARSAGSGVGPALMGSPSYSLPDVARAGPQREQQAVLQAGGPLGRMLLPPAAVGGPELGNAAGPGAAGVLPAVGSPQQPAAAR